MCIRDRSTITRIDENKYYALSGAIAEIHDYDWLVQHILPDEKVSVRNVTDEYGVLVLSGPRSRDLLSKLTDADLSNADFPWLKGKTIYVSGIKTLALRVSYVGELGWELHIPMQNVAELYETLMDKGSKFGISNFGTYAMNSLRMEKAYKGWGSELTTEITPIEAGLERFVDFNKPFIGREATLSRKLLGINTKLVYMEVDADDTDCLGNEPVLNGEQIIGVTTSGAYGHSVKKSLAFAYVEPQYANSGTNFEIRILGQRRSATVLHEAASVSYTHLTLPTTPYV